MIPGLVLEGGAMRGMFTAGVLDAFMERGICAEETVGVSAGALFGVNLLSGQKGRVIRYNKRFNGDRTYMGLIPLLREGNIVSTEYAYERVPRMLDPFDDETFKASPSRFYAVVTDVETGAPEYVRIESVFGQMDVLRASGSMPFVSRPVEIGGKRFLDGGISDSIPFEWLIKRGAGKTVVILTRDASYVKRPMNAMLIKTYKRKYPALAERLSIRHLEYNRQIKELSRLEAEGKAFVIRPSAPVKIGRTERDPGKLRAVYDLGYSDAVSLLDGLKDFLNG